jgi:hypothetical protein
VVEEDYAIVVGGKCPDANRDGLQIWRLPASARSSQALHDIVANGDEERANDFQENKKQHNEVFDMLACALMKYSLPIVKDRSDWGTSATTRPQSRLRSHPGAKV